QFAFWLAPILLASFGTSRAQTAAFTYQGNLIYDGVIANGSYDLQFRLYDQLTGGSLQGSPDTVTVSNVSVISGVFTVELNFGAAAYDSSVRFLEISVRPAGSGSFTTLSPRQKITSTPYAIRSLTVGAASTAANFTGSLAGDVAGAQSATVIQLSAVTAGKIASNQVVKSLNGARDDVTLSAAGNGSIGTCPYRKFHFWNKESIL